MYFILSTSLSTVLFLIAASYARAEPPIMCDLQHKFLNARNILNSEKVMLISCTLMGFKVAVTHAKLFHTITGVQS